LRNPHLLLSLCVPSNAISLQEAGQTTHRFFRSALALRIAREVRELRAIHHAMTECSTRRAEFT
jgi:hypothetical protein